MQMRSKLPIRTKGHAEGLFLLKRIPYSWDESLGISERPITSSFYMHSRPMNVRHMSVVDGSRRGSAPQ